MKIKEIVTRDPTSIHPQSTLFTAAQRMKLLDLGMLPVCKDEQLVGVLTDRDVIVRAVALGLDPKYTATQDIMSADPVYCFEDQEVEEAAQLMESKQVRRLPVLDRAGQLVGVVSLGHLATRAHNQPLAGEVLASVTTSVLR